MIAGGRRLDLVGKFLEPFSAVTSDIERDENIDGVLARDMSPRKGVATPNHVPSCTKILTVREAEIVAENGRAKSHAVDEGVRKPLQRSDRNAEIEEAGKSEGDVHGDLRTLRPLLGVLAGLACLVLWLPEQRRRDQRQQLGHEVAAARRVIHMQKNVATFRKAELAVTGERMLP